MRLTRRTILASGAAFGLLGGTRVWAATEADFGDFSLQTISDGHLELVEPDGTAYDSPLNITLMRRGDDVVLFDCGSGSDFMPSAGMLPEALADAGVAPEDVTHVIFTHGHPDHVWGILDDFAEIAFPNARLLMGRIERDWWMDPATFDSLPEDRQSFVVGAQRRIEAMGDRLELFDDGEELLDGVTARMTPGHTKGHMSFDIGGRLIVLGDSVTSAAQLADPGTPGFTEHFPEEAAATRVALLPELASSGITVIGYHFPDGGVGHIVTEGEGFAFIPEIKS